MRYFLLSLSAVAICVSNTSCSQFGTAQNPSYATSGDGTVQMHGKTFRWERRVVNTSPLETMLVMVEVKGAAKRAPAKAQPEVIVSEPKLIASTAEPVSNVSGAQ